MNPNVDLFLSKLKKWAEECDTLRNIILECQLNEELKWGVPCYTFQNKNILLIQAFKEYCAIGFFKGALLQDANAVLNKIGENAHASRQIRFTNRHEILQMMTLLKAYIYEAIEVEKAGIKIPFQKNPEAIPDELKKKLEESPALKKSFEALTPGRQRAYILYFSAPKQSKTRETRIEKYIQQILDGKGFNDCTCGLSKKLPSCDGSHKFLQPQRNDA